MARPRTNTPLQALTLLNDEAYVEMAMAFAGRILGETGLANDEERINFAFRLVLTREADPVEVNYLTQLLIKRGEELAAEPNAARQLVSSVKGWTMPAGIDAGDSPLTADELRSRAERALAEEIGLMLDEGVVQAVQDIDLAMLLGAGWPFWLGGISAHLDRAGVSEAVTGSRFLPRGVASLPA